MNRGNRIPELDGLRGIAVILVVVAHYISTFFPGHTFFGYADLGVDIFFVLSGFLIGGIILDEVGEPGFLASFYIRRAARILPIYWAVVAASLLIENFFWAQPWIKLDHLLSPWVYLTFTTNIAFTQMPRPHGALLVPTWTLAVEEQFYLCAPLFMMAIPKRWLLSWLVAICLTAIALRHVFESNQAIVQLNLPCRMDSLAIGVSAALLARRHDLTKKILPLLGIAAVALGAIWPLSQISPSLAELLAPTMVSVAMSAIMLSAINGADFARYLRIGWLRFVGAISYGLYLIHQPVLILLTGLLLGAQITNQGASHIPVAILAAVVSFGFATLSWQYFERPIIRKVKGILARKYGMKLSADASAA